VRFGKMMKPLCPNLLNQKEDNFFSNREQAKWLAKITTKKTQDAKNLRQKYFGVVSISRIQFTMADNGVLALLGVFTLIVAIIIHLLMNKKNIDAADTDDKKVRGAINYTSDFSPLIFAKRPKTNEFVCFDLFIVLW
jgi:hypothetical protein